MVGPGAGPSTPVTGPRRHLVMGDGRLLPVFNSKEGPYVIPDTTVPTGVIWRQGCCGIGHSIDDDEEEVVVAVVV